MTNSILTLTLATFILAACTTNSNSNSPNGEAHEKPDSCEIALKFENALLAESMVEADYSGELNNYWGSDTSKLDFKHVFKKGQLAKSYFYYENQTVQEEYSFKCGALHGLQKWYFENGQLAKTIPYSYGYRNGIGRLYDISGQLVEKVTFKNDSLISESQLETH